jgi:hypothetical protein
MTAAQQINRAIRRIRRRGWTQGLEGVLKRQGPYCVVGSFRADVPKRVVFCLCLAMNDDGISDWNDEPGRTKEEVLAVMRVAASLPEAQREI